MVETEEHPLPERPEEEECYEPPPRHREKLLFLMFAGAIGIILLVVGSYRLVEFTDNTSFCGELCHKPMMPEFTTHQASPHSSVTCAECHVGPGGSYLVKSKVSGTPLIIATLSGIYERPIVTPVENLRPASDTCQKCHRPERFAGDVVRVHTTYATDEKNTARTDERVMRVGGGESAVARDIHWHIAATVWYLSLDRKRQDIAWVGVEKADGTLDEYTNPGKAADITPDRIAKEKRQMDCIDCHNRATHIFDSVANLIDVRLKQGKIDAGLPYIKKLGLEALEPANASLDIANAKLDGIPDYYRTNYPQVYQDRKAAIDGAVETLKEVAGLTTFPLMNIVPGKSYPSNLGHMNPDAPGCFRCHGKLQTTRSDGKGRYVTADCNACHYPIKIQQGG